MRKPAFLFLIALVLLLPAVVSSGEIYGDIQDGNGPVSNTRVTVRCQGSYQGSTDEDGSYSVYVQEQGRCTLSITYRGQRASTDVVSYDEPKRYDLWVVCSDGDCRLEK